MSESLYPGRYNHLSVFRRTKPKKTFCGTISRPTSITRSKSGFAKTRSAAIVLKSYVSGKICFPLLNTRCMTLVRFLNLPSFFIFFNLLS